MTCRSADGVSVTELAAKLLAGFGSVAPAGAPMVAVLLSTPTAEETIVAVTVNVAVSPTARSTVVAMLPVPDAAPQAEPASAVQVQDTAVSVGRERVGHARASHGARAVVRDDDGVGDSQPRNRGRRQRFRDGEIGDRRQGPSSVSVAELLAGSDRPVRCAVADAELTIGFGEGTFGGRGREDSDRRTLPAGIVPTWQVMVVVPVHVPCVDVAATSVTPAGSTSVSVTI